MNAEWLRTRGVFAAAVGAGFLLGAAGILLYQQMMAERKRLDRVASSVSLLRRELDHLKSDVKPSRHGSSRTLSDIDMYSAVSKLDEEDEESEFFDLSDDEDMVDQNTTSRNENGAGDAVDVSVLITEIDNLLNGGTFDEKTTAYHIMKQQQQRHNLKNDVSILWRFARTCYAISNTVEGDAKKAYLFEGLEYAKSALLADDNDADAHKWFAILLGSCGDFLPVKDKIGNGYIFKEHLDQAIKIKPADYSLYHMYGRFEFELASLSWLEKKLAASLIAKPPDGSYDEAIKHFLKAEELSPKLWKENRLFLAKCFINLGKYKDCLSWLVKAQEAPCVTPEDEEAEKEVQTLLPKYLSYT